MKKKILKGVDYGSWEDCKKKKERTKTEKNKGKNTEEKKEKHTGRQSRKEKSKNQNGFSKANAQGNENFKREVDPSDQYRNEEVDSMKFS